MKCLRFRRMVTCWLAVFAGGLTLAQEPSSDDAQRLVGKALRAELNGLSEERAQALNAAITVDPSYAPARWHSGQVLTGKNERQSYRQIGEAEKQAAADPLLSKYKSMRRSQADNAAGNAVLARWCQRRGFAERARLHWSRVLRFQPNHETAVRSLNLIQYNGRWYTRQQIAELHGNQARAAKLLREWRPKVIAWRKDFLGADAADQQEVAEKLQRAASAHLVGLFETQLSPYDQGLSRAVVDALANVKEQAATESLVRHAAMSKWPSVRSAATNHLKHRPPHGYVPILIDAMVSPYNFQAWTVRNPVDDDHVLALNYSIGRKGKHVDHLLQGTLNIFGGGGSDEAGDFQEEIEERVEELNEATDRFNEPIWQALKTTTGLDLDNDPSQWNDWWNDYNEYHVPEFKPVFSSFRRSSLFIPFQPFSCFPAGVLVSTETGRRPIEDIRVGDRVLSQDAVTGELSYKAVLDTTVRQSDAIMEMSMNGENLLVTRGHPIWVNGRQWQMAKQLRPGDRLHSVNGPVEVEAIGPAPHDTTVYNLIVADFHTYFVGDARVLVHDNSLYMPPGVSVPGQ